MVQNGFVQTTEDVRFAVKVEASDLQPYTKYFYRFESCEGPDLGVSPVGIFKTLPAEDDEIAQLRLAVFRWATSWILCPSVSRVLTTFSAVAPTFLLVTSMRELHALITCGSEY
jgi:hypothetical protein